MWRPLRVPDACSLIGILDRKGREISGGEVLKALKATAPRYNGLGAGFAAYGIYPKRRDNYALHVMFIDENSKGRVEESIASFGVEIVHDERIPTRKVKSIREFPILWRYFLGGGVSEDEVLRVVSFINGEVDGAFVMSSGKDMGVFKGVGYPWDIAEFYGINEYRGYMWLGHGRYPNTPGWWGGAHPFSVLNWSVIHNGEISSYGTNKRYVEQWGYKCALLTDSEVMAYLLDLLVRRHELPLKVACKVLSPPFWSEIDRERSKLMEAIRVTYKDALVNGPFSIIVATTHGVKGMMGLTDRIKLRPLVAAEKDDRSYIASEECSIRAVCPNPTSTWALKAATPFITTLEHEGAA